MPSTGKTTQESTALLKSQEKKEQNNNETQDMETGEQNRKKTEEQHKEKEEEDEEGKALEQELVRATDLPNYNIRSLDDSSRILLAPSPQGRLGYSYYEAKDETYPTKVVVLQVPNRGYTPVNNIIYHHKPHKIVVRTTASPIFLNRINVIEYGQEISGHEPGTLKKGL